MLGLRQVTVYPEHRWQQSEPGLKKGLEKPEGAAAQLVTCRLTWLCSAPTGLGTSQADVCLGYLECWTGLRQASREVRWHRPSLGECSGQESPVIGTWCETQLKSTAQL
jgi:hypothetical protein